jgi:hypothetical protein
MFLHNFGRMCITTIEFSSNNVQPSVKEPTPQRPKRNPPGRLSGDFNKHELEETAAAGQGKKK